MCIRDRLSQENKEFLSSLGDQAYEKDWGIVHGSPRQPVNEYMFDETVFRQNLNHMTKDLYFIGHTHIPLYFWSVPNKRVGSGFFLSGKEFFIEKGISYIINLGSVGQPRDGDPRASFGIFDDVESTVKFVRLEYDLEKTQKNMREAGLPGFLIERLSYGR